MPQDQPMQSREAFIAKARAEGWVCSMCGKPIEYGDQEAFLEAKRCQRCHDELDTDSGPIATP